MGTPVDLDAVTRRVEVLAAPDWVRDDVAALTAELSEARATIARVRAVGRFVPGDGWHCKAILAPELDAALEGGADTWDRIEDVPVGVEVVSKDGYHFCGCGPDCTFTLAHQQTNQLAPFKRVKS